MLATIAVLNVKAPLAETMRLSAPLFCSVMDAPAAKPLTVPPIVKGPVPPPPPPPPVPPPPEPTGPLQATRRKAVRNRDTNTADLKVDLIKIDCSFGTSRLQGLRKIATDSTFPLVDQSWT